MSLKLRRELVVVRADVLLLVDGLDVVLLIDGLERNSGDEGDAGMGARDKDGERESDARFLGELIRLVRLRPRSAGE